MGRGVRGVSSVDDRGSQRERKGGVRGWGGGGGGGGGGGVSGTGDCLTGRKIDRETPQQTTN